MFEIPLARSLEPYFRIATDEAKNSPCVRRKYGALIACRGPKLYHIARTNYRVSYCCDGSCARSDLGLLNGERVEVGAEVHAETAAIIDYGRRIDENCVMLLVGFAGDRELLSESVYPCHTCALNIKYAGFKFLHIRNRAKEIIPVSISEIIEYREKEWLSDDQDA
jgi:deoxycytidylate deaminase